MGDSGPSSASAAAFPSLLSLPITEKLSKNNLVLWKAQVLPAIRGAQLEGHLDGTDPAPPKEIDVKQADKIIKSPNMDYARWMALDQQVLGYLLTTMMREVMAQVATATTAGELWSAVNEIYSSQTRSRSVNTRISLATLKKGNMPASEYLSKMKALADEMAAAGKPLDDDELVGYVLTGLDADYIPLQTTLVARTTPRHVEDAGQIEEAVAGEVKEEDMVVVDLVIAVARTMGAMEDRNPSPRFGARCAAKLDMVLIDAGTGSKKISYLMKGMSTPP
ncbi:unnamed protein product [Urochloa humidicola]